jgi:hypothetical protein
VDLKRGPPRERTTTWRQLIKILASSYGEVIENRGATSAWDGLTGMEHPSSRNTGAFPDLAVPRADPLGLELARKRTSLLRTPQARHKAAFFRVQLGEDSEHRRRAATSTARILVRAYGLRGARMRGQGEGMG